ncbi:hypothetical protein LC607_06375 [Nostoc sp. CHAB 5824]|nr:hypothetical protein [Nostoc sp. CHAB 5824]
MKKVVSDGNENTAGIALFYLTSQNRVAPLVNLGETTTTLLPCAGQPIQLPTAFFFQLLESGSISIQSKEKLNSTNETVRLLNGCRFFC